MELTMLRVARNFLALLASHFGTASARQMRDEAATIREAEKNVVSQNVTVQLSHP